MSKYSDGYRLECQARDDLRANGYTVIRSASSKTPVDLIAIKPGELLFVQCKTGGRIGATERMALRGIAVMARAVPLSAAWHKEGRAARTVAYTQWTSNGPAGGHPWTPDHALEASA